MAYVSGIMKWLKRCDRLNGGSISLKLAQVPVYLQGRVETVGGYGHAYLL